MSDTTTRKHTGGCQCGAVRYALTEEPSDTGICHCRMCQKASGGPFMAFTGVPRDALIWTRGKPAVFRSSAVSERGYCADCGTPLTYDFLEGDRITFQLYTLDDPSSVSQPDRQIGTESRAAWLDGINEFPGKTIAEDSGEDFVRACVNFQHPDHDTPDDWAPPKA
ncbi:MAG: GFA family protein [Hyphomicrobiaceae bacterium]